MAGTTPSLWIKASIKLNSKDSCQNAIEESGWLPGDNWNKESLIGGVINAVPQREVEAVVLASTSPNVPTKEGNFSEGQSTELKVD